MSSVATHAFSGQQALLECQMSRFRQRRFLARFLLRIAPAAGIVLAIFLIAGADARRAFAQSDDEVSSFGEPPAADNPFADAEQAELYDEVLDKLRKLKRTPSSRHDSSLRNEDDWFVVGGSLADLNSGYIEANFNSFQGVEDVAQRIVEFQFGTYNGKVPSWRVFSRTGDAGLAEEKAIKQAERFQRWLVAQAERQRRMQQQRAQQASRASRPRGGGC